MLWRCPITNIIAAFANSIKECVLKDKVMDKYAGAFGTSKLLLEANVFTPIKI